MYRVTIATADAALRASVDPALRADGLDVVAWDLGREGADTDPAAAPDVLVLDLRDVGLPPRSALLDAWPDALVMGVLGPSQLAGLDPGLRLDDFATVPVQPGEFVARIRLLLWRHGRTAPRNALTAGELVVDQTNYQVFEGGKPVTLTYKEYELLRFLMTHAGAVFTREQLLNRVWGYQYYGGARTVDVHVRRLRGKLELSGRTYIDTVRNVGYRFSQPLR